MAIEIVDLPIDSMVISHNYVSLPEGTTRWAPNDALKGEILVVPIPVLFFC